MSAKKIDEIFALLQSNNALLQSNNALLQGQNTLVKSLLEEVVGVKSELCQIKEAKSDGTSGASKELEKVFALLQTNNASLQNLTSLIEEVEVLKSEVSTMKNQRQANTDGNAGAPKLANLPLDTVEGLTAFEEELTDEVTAQLKNKLQHTGGSQFPTYIKNCIKAVVSDELAAKLSWRGTDSKPSIRQFSLLDIIRDVALTKFPTGSDNEFNKVCQQHTLHAQDRLNKRKK